MKLRDELFSLVACACLLGTLVATTGCGESAPPPAPVVETPATPEYNAGEAAYQKQG